MDDNYIDISWPITESITAWKDNKTVKYERVRTWEKDQARQSIITMDIHTGTHIDAPSHFLQSGPTIEHMPIDKVIGNCVVLDLTTVDNAISSKHLEQSHHTFSPGDIILFKTKNSNLSATEKFNHDFIYLDISGATFLADKKIKAIGTDYLGIERQQPAHETHTILLGNGIPIIEGLRLANVNPGKYFLICLPLNIIGLEGAPARAILQKERKKMTTKLFDP